MIEEPVLRKLLPLPYVPGEWQLTALRWWVKLRIPVFALAALLLIPVANTLFWIIYFALPTAMQLLTAMLALAFTFHLIYWKLQNDPALIDLLAVAAILMFIVTMMGIAPVVTYWLMVAFLASIMVATLKTEGERLIQRVRTA